MSSNPVTYLYEGVVVSPYLFIKEQDALKVVEHGGMWPDPIAKTLVVRPGPPELFLNSLKSGFPNTRPNRPDAFSLNCVPGEMLTTLVPLTKKGAVLADRMGQTTFWRELSDFPGALHRHAIATVEQALGLSSPD